MISQGFNKHGDFIFTDLSTYDLDQAKDFYSFLFDWQFHTEDGLYHLAYLDDQQICGLYETPDFFQKIKMPSFWMSYIQVDQLEPIISKTKAHGAKLELLDTENRVGKIALIRDPLGAGFTIYEGDQLSTITTSQINTYIGSQLYVSDFDKVAKFYQDIFGWSLDLNSIGSLDVTHHHRKISAMTSLPDGLLTKEEYWLVYFQVQNKYLFHSKLKDIECEWIYEDEHEMVIKDFSGAAFGVKFET